MSSAEATDDLDENSALIEGILNEEIPFDILRFERGVPRSNSVSFIVNM
jgi:hypothetical protein